MRAVFLGDAISRYIILEGIYEGRELDALSKHVFPRLERPATALDIGANIGNHASYFAAHFDRVVAFEPNPPVAAVLRANVMAQKVEVVETGLSDKLGELHFAVNQTNLGGSRVTADPSGMTIKVDTLDRLVEPLGLENVRFVKIDVERHEEKVLEGATTFLTNQLPVIAMEGHYKSFPELGKRVAALLKTFGYRYIYSLGAPRHSVFDRRVRAPAALDTEDSATIGSVDARADQ